MPLINNVGNTFPLPFRDFVLSCPRYKSPEFYSDHYNFARLTSKSLFVPLTRARAPLARALITFFATRTCTQARNVLLFLRRSLHARQSPHCYHSFYQPFHYSPFQLFEATSNEIASYAAAPATVKSTAVDISLDHPSFVRTDPESTHTLLCKYDQYGTTVLVRAKQLSGISLTTETIQPVDMKFCVDAEYMRSRIALELICGATD